MVKKDETKKVEGAEETDAPEDKPTGDTPEEISPADTEDARLERLENIERTLARMEKAGRAEAAIPEPKAKVLDPIEFAEAFQRGELGNPLKD